MVGVGPPGDRGNADAGIAQSEAQVVILTAPAAEVFVVAVNAFIVGAGDSEVSAEELGPGWTTKKRVQAWADVPPAHFGFFERRDALQIAATANVLFGDLLGDRLVEMNGIAGQ